ncbi:hypothetical protein N7508_007192 [Penicillium antarcticum]|uniref:uncharacterized protein n=1 Tax=Penicillium antarcticum TaxID=416450 RepID=UPI00238A3BAA|nr:uncharacterized protein N7508_007192 [Penicillium antarcticum]KAJ5302329.1 hypothetical protein N7508_007192 [Penicillium antarcticum]
MAASDIAGHTPQGLLPQSAYQGNLAQVRALLENGEDHRIWDKFGWTALHWAIVGGQLNVVKQLLEHNAEYQQPDLDFRNMSQEQVESYADALPPIIVAAQRQKLDQNAVDIFCELVHYLEIPDNKLPAPKFNAIWRQGAFDTTRFTANMWRVIGKAEYHCGFGYTIPHVGGVGRQDLKNRRADVTEWKSVLMQCAIRDSQWEVLQMLIKAGADVNSGNPLWYAAFRSDARYVECLADHGADINAALSDGRTALHEAVMNGYLDTIIALVDRGAAVNPQQTQEYCELSQHINSRLSTKDFNFWFARRGASTLMQACGFLLGRNDKFRRKNPADQIQTPEEKTMGIVTFLLSKGADPSLKEHRGMTALHFAVLQPHVPLVKALVEAGASVEASDCEGRIPLHYLSRCDDNVDEADLREVICLLCQNKDHKFSQSLLNKPVLRPSQLCEYPRSGIRSRMITQRTWEGNRSYFNDVEDDSHTALDIALLSSRWKVVHALTSLGAILPTNTIPERALICAIKELEVSPVRFLLQNGFKAPDRSLITLLRSFLDLKSKRDAAGDLETRLRPIMKLLILAGADVNFNETDQVSPNVDEKAGMKNDEEDDEDEEDEDEDEDEGGSRMKVEERIKNGPKISTPLNLAASIGGLRNILEDLLLSGADVYGFSSLAFDPILNAAVYGNSQDLQLLLEYALSHPNESHWSMFLGNVPKEDDPVVYLCHCLKQAGALDRANFQGRTLLHLAAEQGNETLLKSLIIHGARIDILDNQGLRAIECAAMLRHAHIFESLLTADYETDPRSHEHTKFGKSKCEADLALLNPQTNPEVMSSLLRLAPEYILNRYLGREVCPTVYAAVVYGSIDLLLVLLNHNAEIEAGDCYGWRPLHHACYRGQAAMVQALIAKGADIHCSTDAWNDRNDKPTGLYLSSPWAGTPLHLAAMGGHLDIVRVLLDLGVDVHASTVTKNMDFPCWSPGHGPTALHLALDTGVYYGRQGEMLSNDRLKIAQLLVDAGSMVSGVANKMNLGERSRFYEFPDLWAALKAGDMNLAENEAREQA